MDKVFDLELKVQEDEQDLEWNASYYGNYVGRRKLRNSWNDKNDQNPGRKCVHGPMLQGRIER